MQNLKNQSLIILLLLSLTSCVNEAWIGRKVKKSTPEAVLGYLQKHNADLFITKRDTIRDTVVIKRQSIDTVFSVKQLVDTITITKNNVTTKIWIRHDSLFIDQPAVHDTIIVEKIVNRTLPSKDYSKPYDWSWVWLILSAIGCLYLIFKWRDRG